MHRSLPTTIIPYLKSLLNRSYACQEFHSITQSSSRTSKLTDKHIQMFESALDYSRNPSSILKDPKDIEAYNIDWLGQYRGFSKLVLRPKSTQEMAEIVRICYDQELPMCFQGGNTGLVGGSVPVSDEVVISTTRMNRIDHFDHFSGVLTCQAGCILENLDSYVSEHGYMMPLDLGAKGSCVIGGNFATGAGGVRLLRFGSLHAHLLGLEVVTANGQVLSMMNTLRKDNTGFHLPHLFVGSEGQFGIITKVAMTCVPRCSSVNVAFLGCKSFDDCCRLLNLARSKLGEILSSFEFVDRGSLECVEEHLKLRRPFDTTHEFYILIETMGSDSVHDSEKLTRFLDTSMQEGLVENGTIASSATEAKAIWSLRESITESLKHDGYVHKCDVSLPLKDFYELVLQCRDRAGSQARRVVGYGHLGDGNLHLNITEPKLSSQLTDKLFPFIYDWTVDKGGSISAEHGIGILKLKYWHYSKTPHVMTSMRQLKKMFDPKLLFNPGKTLLL